MSNAIAAAALPMDPSNRRLVGGLLASLLLHALALLLQFGIPGLRPGPGGPLTVRLAPPAQPMASNPPAASPVPPAQTLAMPAAGTASTALPAPLQPPVEQASRPHAGFTLVDPARPQPTPTPEPLAVAPHRTPRRRARVRTPATHDGLHTDVIAQAQRKDDSFSVPPVAGDAAPDPEPLASAEPPNIGDAVPESTPEQGDAQGQEAERSRLAEQRDQERDQAREQALQARRDADEQALHVAAEADAKRAAEQQARVLAEQDTRYQDELARRQRQAEEDSRLAEEAQRQAAARQLAEQQRIQDEQARARQLAEQQRVQAQQARAQQLAEQQRVRAEQVRAQQLAEQQRIQAEQVRAQQLAEQQRAAHAHQRELQARQQAEQLAREQAQQAVRLAQQEQARRQQGHGDDAGDLMRAGPVGAIAGEGAGNANGSGAGRGGSLVARARDLLRGIDIDKPIPPVMRPAEDARRAGRRALADAILRDVPLRMYIDSVRQKIERNAVVGPALLAEDVVRVFPVVSIAIRSDGSVDDVTIVRSSGRADVDEIVRRIVRLNARYAAFPPNVASNYDVVELRRVWSFSGALRLLEEMR